MDLSQEVILVIGAGRGIGRAAAHLFAEANANLALASRDDAELAELEFKLNRQTSGQVAAIPTDVTDAAQVSSLIETTLNRFGQIDTLVYAAGVGALKPFAETGADEFEQLWRVNARGAFLALQAALPAMEARKKGRVITIPGILGRQPMAQAAAYSAAKYALTGLVKSLALEYRRFGIQFSLLHLGGVNTTFWDNITMRVQRERMLNVEAAAQAVFFAATQPDAGGVNEVVMMYEPH
jgi:NAD(P)-dependent dehydrogenase (short-subunit alcohol dehydrogenase family)